MWLIGHEAKKRFLELRQRYPSDPRASLHLAEIELNLGNVDRNAELLAEAEKIDFQHPLLTLQKAIRQLRLGVPMAPCDSAEDRFPSESRLRASFYRIHSILLAKAGAYQEALRYVDESIRLNPNKFSAYDAKIAHLQGAAHASDKGKERLEADMNSVLEEISRSEEIFLSWGELDPRSRAFIHYRKYIAHLAREDRASIERSAREGIGLLLQCHFDHTVESLLIDWLQVVAIPREALDSLLKNIVSSEKRVAAELEKRILVQLIYHEAAPDDIKSFFEKIGSRYALDLIDAMEEGNVERIAALVKGDEIFSFVLFNVSRNSLALRRRILEDIPESSAVERKKLLMLMAYDEGKIDEAFDLLRDLGISAFQTFECDMLLKVAKAKEAWDFVVEILNRMLERETEVRSALQLKLTLIFANVKLGRFADVASMGESILASEEERGLLGDDNKERLLGQTAQARLMRGEYSAARALLASCAPLPKSYEFKVGVEAKVCLKNGDKRGALAALVEGITHAGNPTPEQYGGLYMMFVELSGIPDLSDDDDESVRLERFVKIQGQERWYFVGKGDALDATKASPEDFRGSELLGKKVGDEVVLGGRHLTGRRAHTIERILPIEKYVQSQSIRHAQQLSEEGRWDTMEVIEVPTVDGRPDLTQVMARLEQGKGLRDKFLEMYRRDAIPLALLAVNEGGLTHALGTISRDQHAFVRFSTGEITDLDRQKAVARRLISGEPFYLDGTSALMLSQAGLVPAVYPYLACLKVPQSVITFLQVTGERFWGSPKPAGRMALVGGEPLITAIDAEMEVRIENNLREGIRLFESRPGAVIAISAAVKDPSFIEQVVPGYMSDACILAQRDGTPVVTEDYFYLQTNEIGTKKRSPEHCSSFALVRVLYEDGKLSFDQYLTYFANLAASRFRFLPLATEDIEKAVFGDGVIIEVQPKRIHLLHFPLTLSVAYGVPLDLGFQVVGRFMRKVLLDDTVPVEATERIFAEILSVFPVEDSDRRRLSSLFQRMASEAMVRKRAMRLSPTERTDKKAAALSQLVTMFIDRRVLEILPLG